MPTTHPLVDVNGDVDGDNDDDNNDVDEYDCKGNNSLEGDVYIIYDIAAGACEDEEKHTKKTNDDDNDNNS